MPAPLEGGSSALSSGGDADTYAASWRTAVAHYEGLEPEFRAIIDSLDVKS